MSVLQPIPKGRLSYLAEDVGLGESYESLLYESGDFQEIFEVVKRSVKECLGLERSGLVLHLQELPMEVGAFHKVGTDVIVLNKALIDLAVRVEASLTEMKALIYSVLLHEYLHSLGIHDEHEVRALTNKISRRVFGEAHPATILARLGPWAILHRNSII
ncbi:MAG: hypothetical protein ACUVTM_04115 [Candidatus Bathyarchaeia archaeon]